MKTFVDDNNDRWMDGFWRVKTDGTEKSKILDRMPTGGFDIDGDTIYIAGIIVYRGWIYYQENVDHSGSLYRMKTDGSEKTKLSDDKAMSKGILGDWIFYRAYYSATKASPVYRINLDGSNKKSIG